MARFSAMGDVAMTIPVIYGLALANPQVQFVMLTKPGLVKMFVNPPANLRIEGVELGESTLADMRQLTATVRRVKPDIFVDLHDVLRSRFIRLVCRALGIRVRRFDKMRAAKRRLVAGRSHQAITPTTLRYAQAFDGLGLNAPTPFATIFGARENAPVQLFASLTPPKPASQKWIGIAPFAKHGGKIYPLDKMRRAMELMLDNESVHIFLFGGGRRETELLTSLANGLQRVTLVAGSGLDLKAELALMAQMDLMITMDSANMHLAALAGTPVLSIWGATHPDAGFAPWQSPGCQNRVMQAQLDCRPCSIFGNKPCRSGTFECMLAISPAAVAAEAAQMLAL